LISEVNAALPREGKLKSVVTVPGVLEAAAAKLPGDAPNDATMTAAILLVEDHPINQKLATVLLERLGYTVDLAADGAQGVAAAQTRQYALILMDVQMPIMNGFEATQQIRTGDGLNKATPIVALTANAMQSDKEACFEAGMNDFMTKPFNKEALMEIVARHIPSN
jgi:CheY-like chemotaxis protein